MDGTSRVSASLATLQMWFSAPRIARYVEECDGRAACVEDLYRWNVAVSAAFFEEICYFEVILRNALHRHLTSWHRWHARRGEWFDDPAKVLSERCRDDIIDARFRLKVRRSPETPAQLVSELNLGFWRYLFDQHHQVLWAQCLHRTFPHMPTRLRAEVQRRVNRLHALRNRIAHHEPIHHLDLAGVRRDLVEVISWIDPDAARWLTKSCRRLPWLLAHRPNSARRRGDRNPP